VSESAEEWSQSVGLTYYFSIALSSLPIFDQC
jgi:hypothetical protein